MSYGNCVVDSHGSCRVFFAGQAEMVVHPTEPALSFFDRSFPRTITSHHQNHYICSEAFIRALSHRSQYQAITKTNNCVRSNNKDIALTVATSFPEEKWATNTPPRPSTTCLQNPNPQRHPPLRPLKNRTLDSTPHLMPPASKTNVHTRN
jgi:hypothetical protein